MQVFMEFEIHNTVYLARLVLSLTYMCICIAWGWSSKPKDSYDGRKMVLVDLDYHDKYNIDTLHNEGHIVTCYISTGTSEPFRQDVKDNQTAWNSLATIKMADWNEKWLDIRQEKRPLLEALMKPRFERAASIGCDAFEADNVDCYGNKECRKGMGKISFDDAKALEIGYIKWQAELAHSLGMAFILKNALAIIPDVIDFVDAAMNEQCLQYNECDTLKPFIDQNKAVFHVEYNNKKTICKNSYQKFGLSTRYCKGDPNQGLCKKGTWMSCQLAQDPLPPTYTSDGPAPPTSSPTSKPM